MAVVVEDLVAVAAVVDLVVEEVVEVSAAVLGAGSEEAQGEGSVAVPAVVVEEIVWE